MKKSKKIIIHTILLFTSILFINSASARQCSTEIFKQFSNPMVQGWKVDICMKTNSATRACTPTYQKKVADAYCKMNNFDQSAQFQAKKIYNTTISNHIGKHSLLMGFFNSSTDKHVNHRDWRLEEGKQVFKTIVCINKKKINCLPPVANTMEKIFINPTVRGLVIDKCIKSSKPQISSPTALVCNKTSQKLAANGFCKMQGFKKSIFHQLKKHIGSHNIWDIKGRKGNFTLGFGIEIFEKIRCTKRN